MKKIIALSLIMLFLSGCVFSKVTVIRLDGDNIKMPTSAVPIQGDNLKGYIMRQLFWTNETGREVPSFYKVEE